MGTLAIHILNQYLFFLVIELVIEKDFPELPTYKLLCSQNNLMLQENSGGGGGHKNK